jgi:hypothetical protein
MSFVSKSLEQNLQSVARSKVVDEAIEIRKQREIDRVNGKEESDLGAHVVMMIGNGAGMFQIISSKLQVCAGNYSLHILGNQGPNEGTACRIHGRIPVLKGDGDRLLITPSNMLNLPGLFAGVEFGDGKSGSNFSHRIERFNFGHHVAGLISPLSGTEKISQKGKFAAYK